MHTRSALPGEPSCVRNYVPAWWGFGGGGTAVGNTFRDPGGDLELAKLNSKMHSAPSGGPLSWQGSFRNKFPHPELAGLPSKTRFAFPVGQAAFENAFRAPQQDLGTDGVAHVKDLAP